MKKIILLTLLAFAIAAGPEVAMSFDATPTLVDGN
jgi:hypothetical protein